MGISQKAREILSLSLIRTRPEFTIRLDTDIIDYFKIQLLLAGGGNCQSLINEVLRKHMRSGDQDLEKRLRKIIREELKKAS